MSTTARLVLVIASFLPFLLHSQAIEISYAVKKGQAPAPDTVLAYAQSTSNQTVGIRAVNISLAFSGGAGNLISQQSYFRQPWTPTFERNRVDTTALTYWGHTYQNRWNYAIGDAIVNANSIIHVPADTSPPLQILELRFQSLDPGLVYFENQSENIVNQIGDVNFRQVAYSIRALPGTFPVAWSHFSAKSLQGGVVELHWETASELNNDFFVVERSDGFDFINPVELGRVQGQGSSGKGGIYSFIDTRFGEKQSFYRLRQVDIDGSFSFSNIIQTSVLQPEFILAAGPSPAKAYLDIQLSGIPEEGYKLLLGNMKGQTAWSLVVNSPSSRIQTIRIPTHSLRQGIYFLKFSSTDANSTQRVQKILIE